MVPTKIAAAHFTIPIDLIIILYGSKLRGASGKEKICLNIDFSFSHLILWMSYVNNSLLPEMFIV